MNEEDFKPQISQIDADLKRATFSNPNNHLRTFAPSAVELLQAGGEE
jgi:hypothetical protein